MVLGSRGRFRHVYILTHNTVAIKKHLCVCMFRTCPEDVAVALGAITCSSPSHDVQDVYFSTWQVGDVTADL